MAAKRKRLDTASPEEARRILRELARMLDIQPTFDLPNQRDRDAWEQEQRRNPENQRKLDW